MPLPRRRASAGPIVTSLMLVALLLPSALLPATGSVFAPPDCPLQDGAATASVVAPMSDDACEHAAPSPCLILACGITAPPPAIRAAGTILAPAAGWILLQGGPDQRLVDLFRTGPPTPPPNQI